MVRLFIIADDFTGALDTGIQFAKRGIKTQVFTECNLDIREVKEDTEVLVADTESRPMDRENAYRTVKEAADWAKKQGIEIIFKKTDSALRGNIGAELQAAADAFDGETLYFLPGYPEIERITKGGIHYIGGELLEDSVFGKDPFDPRTKSYIPDIIGEQSSMTVSCIKPGEAITDCCGTQQGIVVCDTVLAEDIDGRLEELIKKEELKVIAGCAALADRLADKLTFKRSDRKTFTKTDGMYVACGSLNRITREQVEYAEKTCGFARKHLTMEQKLVPAYYESEEGRAFLKKMLDILKVQKKLIVDTFDSKEDKKAFLDHYNIEEKDIRKRIAQSHGQIVKEIAGQELDVTVLMTGGDTLMGYMSLIGCPQLEPICEIGQGAVVSQLEWNGYKQQVISKSGGFGTKEILCEIGKKILKKN